MSSVFEAPQIPESTPVQALAPTEQSHLLQAAISLKRIIARGTLSLSLGVAGGAMAGTVLEMAEPHAPAARAAEFINDYPHLNAAPHEPGPYEWWVDENNNGVRDVAPPARQELKSPRNFYYRNCTDGVAYWVKKYTDVSIPGTWGSATNWDTAASSYTVKAANANNIEPGDIAQSDSAADGAGHVGFVVGITKDANHVVTAIEVAELNHGGDGEYGVRPYNRQANGKFWPYASHAWDHFIDVNGTDKGLNNESISSPSINYGPRSVAVVPNALGGFSVFEAGDNGSLRYKDQTYPGEDLAVKPWGDISVPVIGAPEIVAQGNGTFAVFSHGQDHRLHHSWQTAPGSGWAANISPWNFSLRGDPAVALNYTGGMSVFVPDSNGAMREIDQIGAYTDMGGRPVQNLGGNFQGKPAVMNVGGKLVLFARTAGNQLQTNYQTSVGGAWSGWETIGGGATIITDPKVVTNRLGGMTVVAVGGNGTIVGIDQLYQGESMNKPFYSLGNPGASFTRGLGVIQSPNGEQMVFAATESGAVYHRYQQAAGGYAWSGYLPLSGDIVSAGLTAVRNQNNGVSLFGRSADGDIITLDQPAYGSAFNADWIDLGR
jgi:hypothetical protein